MLLKGRYNPTENTAGHSGACLRSQHLRERCRQSFCEFQASESYILRPCVKKERRKKKTQAKTGGKSIRKLSGLWGWLRKKSACHRGEDLHSIKYIIDYKKKIILDPGL